MAHSAVARGRCLTPGTACTERSTGSGGTPSCARTPRSTSCAVSSGTSGARRSLEATWNRLARGWTSSSTRSRRASAPGWRSWSTAKSWSARPIEISFLPRGTALMDEDLIRTKVSLIPESVSEIRVVDIVGLDKQADGGTHVRSTDEVGRIRVVKTESKGKANKRIRLEVLDA